MRGAPDMTTQPTQDAMPIRALVMWGLGAVYFLYAFTQRVAPSVMVGELMRDLQVGAAVLGNLAAVYLYVYAGVQIPVGLMFDRFGVRRLMAGALVIAMLGSLVFAAAENVAMAYLGRVLIGIGVSCSWVGALTVAAQWLPTSRFAMFAGLTQLLGMAGGILGQAPLAASIQAIGWRMTTVIIGVLALVLGLAIVLVVRDRQRHVDAPTRLLDALYEVARKRDTWTCSAFGFCMTGPMLAFAGLWSVPFLMTVYGFERTTAAAIASLLFAGWGVGAPSLGYLSDRLRRRKLPMIAASILSSIVISLLVFGPVWPTPILMTLMLVQGAAGSCMVLSFALGREHHRPEVGGVALGLINTSVTGAGALLQPLCGLVLDLAWDGAIVDGVRRYTAENYRTALAILPVVTITGVVFSFTLREARRT
jgi:MFS family permease